MRPPEWEKGKGTNWEGEGRFRGLKAGRDVDGIVEMMLDARGNFNQKLTVERLFSWHRSMFPLGTSGMQRIRTGAWRQDEKGPMQVVSGALGKELVHFQAPDAAVLEGEMAAFLDWLETNQAMDPVIKSALGHFWFVTLHTFEDGNGRMARAIGDMLLARSYGQKSRFYSMSSQISNERKSYYERLEAAQRGDLDLSAWIEWYLNCLNRALEHSEGLLTAVIVKHRFWANHGDKVENQRQRKILTKLLDESLGKLTTSRWARVAKCSQDTALRDIQKLIERGLLMRLEGGGRSTAYSLSSKALSEASPGSPA
jgi:Fic family protein